MSCWCQRRLTECWSSPRAQITHVCLGQLGLSLKPEEIKPQNTCVVTSTLSDCCCLFQISQSITCRIFIAHHPWRSDFGSLNCISRNFKTLRRASEWIKGRTEGGCILPRLSLWLTGIPINSQRAPPNSDWLCFDLVSTGRLTKAKAVHCHFSQLGLLFDVCVCV